MKTIPVAVIHPMDPPGRKIGGIETFVRQFVEFSPPDFRVKLVGIATDPARHPPGSWTVCRMGEREIDFFPLQSVPRPELKPFLPLSLTFVARNILRRKRIDAGLKNSLLTFHRPECALPFLRPGPPAFLFVHSPPSRIGDRHSSSRWRSVPGVYSRVEKSVLGRMEKVYCVSRETAGYYRDRCGDRGEKFEFLPTGVNRQIFRRLPEKTVREFRERFLNEHRLSPSDRLIIFIGRLVEPKNLPLLMETAAAARRRDPRLKLLLVGEGPREAAARTAASAAGLGTAALFLGRHDPESIARICQVCSVFLSTSTFEGMPISLLEALSCGLPAVVTGAGETGNLVRDGVNGRVVAGRDPEKLAAAVREVIGRPEVYTPRKAAAAAEPYSVERILDGVYTAIRKSFDE